MAYNNQSSKYLYFSLCDSVRLMGVGRVDEGVVLCCGEQGIIVADINTKAILNMDTTVPNKVKRQPITDRNIAGERCGDDVLDYSLVNNVDKKEVVVIRHLEEVEHNQILDLNVDGDRWEGDVLEDWPCGWGVLYDKHSRPQYEGFRVGNVNVCWGRKYYSDIEVVEYEGEWCAGKKWGHGQLFDRAGKEVYSGDWRDDERIAAGSIAKEIIISNERYHVLCLMDLRVGSGCYCDDLVTIDFDSLSLLRSLTIGDNCFGRVNEVNIIGWKLLESVTIGDNCFTLHKQKGGYNKDRHFCVKNCVSLKSLKIGRYSFSDYTVCEIEENSALHEITIGVMNEESYNFSFSPLKLIGNQLIMC